MRRVVGSSRAWVTAAATGAGVRASTGGAGGDSDVARCDSKGDALGSIMCWSIASVVATEVLYDYMYVSRHLAPTPAGSAAVDVGVRKGDAELPASTRPAGEEAAGRVVGRRVAVAGAVEGTVPPAVQSAISLGTIIALSTAAAAAACMVAGRQQARASIPVHRSRARTSSRPAWAATSVTVLQRQHIIDARRVAWRTRPGLAQRPVQLARSTAYAQQQPPTPDVKVPALTTTRPTMTVLDRQQAIDARRVAWRSRSGLAQRQAGSNRPVSAEPNRAGGTGQVHTSRWRQPILHGGEGSLRPRITALHALPTSGLFHYALDDSQLSPPKHISEVPRLVENGSLHGQIMVWWEGAENWVIYADCVGMISEALNATRSRVRRPLVSDASRQVDVLALLDSIPPRGLYRYSQPRAQARSSFRQSRGRRLPVLARGPIEPVQDVVPASPVTKVQPKEDSLASFLEPTQEQLEVTMAALGDMNTADANLLLQRARDATAMAELRSIVKEYSLPVREASIAASSPRGNSLG